MGAATLGAAFLVASLTQSLIAVVVVVAALLVAKWLKGGGK